MPSSGMLRRVAVVRIDAPSHRASVVSYGERSKLTDSCHPDEGGATFLRNVGYNKIFTA
jgi:hypothetical protein